MRSKKRFFKFLDQHQSYRSVGVKSLLMVSIVFTTLTIKGLRIDRLEMLIKKFDLYISNFAQLPQMNKKTPATSQHFAMQNNPFYLRVFAKNSRLRIG